MSVSTGFSSLSIDDVLTKIPEQTIANYYFGISEIPCVIQAPYRIDKKPSVGIYYNSKGHINFKDFASGDSGGIVDLLMKTWNLDFKHTINKIEKECPKILTSLNLKNTISISTTHHRASADIKVSFREWKKHDIEYWNAYGISLEWLKFGDIYPISRIFYTIDNKTIDFPAEKYAYAYIERKEGIVTMKIYQPFSENRKWLSKHDSSVWDLWSKLPNNGPTLIITSSRKDALCIWENTGIPAVSLQGEGYIPKDHVIQELKDRFINIYVLYDNDYQSEINHGREFGKQLAEKFNLIQIEIPDLYKSKDTSDLCKNHSRETVYKVINELIKTPLYIDDLPF